MVHRILTGLPFVVDPPTGCINWPAETEDVIRLSIELARVTRSGLAFAAVGQPPEGDCDCGDVDRWLSDAEDELEQLTHTDVARGLPIESGAWMGKPLQEWAMSARESEMDLLIIPGGWSDLATHQHMTLDSTVPKAAGCPVWFAGREPDRLEDAPPLIVVIDDPVEKPLSQFQFAVELALAWNARLLIVSPTGGADGPISREATDELRRNVFERLSRTDFRTLSHGSQLRVLGGGLQEILDQISQEQIPNLVIGSTKLVPDGGSSWRGHIVLWPVDLDQSQLEQRD